MRRDELPYEAWKAWDSMSEYERELLGAPSHRSSRCLACGKVAQNDHHVIPKRMGGRCKEILRLIPTVSLCGLGNASGCHKLAHEGRLHFRYRDGWEVLKTPIPMSHEDAFYSHDNAKERKDEMR